MNEKAKALLEKGATDLGIDLPSYEVGQFSRFADELKKWNRKFNLTAIKEDEEIAVKHFLDSLTILKTVRSDGRLLDVGSGAGFPAIPLKIACSSLDILSVDAVEKKVFFQRHVARILGLERFRAVHSRAEDLKNGYENSFDWVVSRAFSDIAAYVKIALPFLAPNGRIIAMKGKSGREEALASAPLLCDSGAEVSDVIEFRLPVFGDARSLIIVARKRLARSEPDSGE